MRTTTLRSPSCLALACLVTLACQAPADDDGGADSSGGSASMTTTAPSTASTTSASDSGSADSTGAADSTGGMSDPSAMADFFARWPGLWAGPVDSMTSAGDFPTMNMDVRAADGYTLFSRCDLDGGNSVRMAMAIEQHGGEDVLTFRNGGYFLGIMRDSRTTLVEADLEAERFRFCALDGGCDYIDAVFDFEGPDALDMHVNVRGNTHFDWPATRKELREVATPFPQDDTALPGDQPFPEMPTLTAHLSWSTPLAEAADAWLILSTENCGVGGCNPSRFIRGHAEAGATSIDVVMDQIHPGDYKTNAMLDRNGNLAGTFLPDAGDAVAIPNGSASVAAGENEISLALIVEL